MPLQAIYDTLTDVPEQFHELYSERNDKFVLTGIEGVKTQADVDQLKESLANEKRKHTETKDRYRPFFDLDADDVLAKLDKYDELEAQLEAGGNKIDEEKLNDLVEKRLQTKMRPVQRQLDELTSANEELTATNQKYEQADFRRGVHDEIRAATLDAKIIPEAVDDLLMIGERLFERDDTGKFVTKDGVGVTPGIDAKYWLADHVENKPYLLQGSQGGGARTPNGKSGGVVNPWTRENWNKSKQFRLAAEDPEMAKSLAKAAGVDVTATKPLAKASA